MGQMMAPLRRAAPLNNPSILGKDSNTKSSTHKNDSYKVRSWSVKIFSRYTLQYVLLLVYSIWFYAILILIVCQWYDVISSSFLTLWVVCSYLMYIGLRVSARRMSWDPGTANLHLCLPDSVGSDMVFPSLQLVVWNPYGLPRFSSVHWNNLKFRTTNQKCHTVWVITIICS